jgi:hypothetical protein
MVFGSNRWAEGRGGEGDEFLLLNLQKTREFTLPLAARAAPVQEPWLHAIPQQYRILFSPPQILAEPWCDRIFVGHSPGIDGRNIGGRATAYSPAWGLLSFVGKIFVRCCGIGICDACANESWANL